MEIIRANERHLDDIDRLLKVVHKVHSDNRSDLFRKGLQKYSKEEVLSIMKDDNTPIYVCVDNDIVLGYAFVIYLQNDKPSLVDIKTMYIDDVCVDEKYRHIGVATRLFAHLERVAKDNNCYNMLLNVYNFNTSAMRFYQKCGMKPLKTYMEKIIK